jgi:uncharacterized protein YbjT (DUF2867 family)
MYVITGATGNTGKPITMALLKAGKKVRIISRSAEKAKELTGMGAELFIGDTTQTAMLKEAFNGATAVYAMIPLNRTAPDYTAHQEKHASSIAGALEHCRVKFVVTLSSIGADLEEGSGVVLGLNRMEKLFNRIKGLNALHLRPSYFMENTLGMIGLIKQAGIMGSPLKGDLRMPVISTGDIAAYAVKRLLDLDFKGTHVQYLLGSGDVTYNEMAKAYGAAIGKPDLPYVEFSYDDFRKSFIDQAGASPSLADKMNEFIKAVNEGRVVAPARNAENTTPTSIREFANTFRYVYTL